MKKTTHILATLAFTLMPLTSFALEWSPQLNKAKQGEYREPMEEFSINIPGSVPIEILQTLALELDNIDVTAMVSREGTYAKFTPAQPLEWGKHILRLVEYADDGSISEKGFWEFEVRRSSMFREADYAADINLVASQRVADKNLVPTGTEEPNGFTGQGGAVFQARVADEDWEVTGSMDLIYNSEKNQTSNNRELDLGEYLITGKRNSTQINIGQHSLTQSSLVMEGFYRRGVSASTSFEKINSAASGFVLRSEELIGFRQGLGVSDSNNTVNGIIWESQPFTDNPEQLYVSATYLSGKSNKIGAAIGAEQAKQNGNAFSLVADSTLLDQQLRLRAEVASSTIDIITANTTDTDIINGKGDAIAFLASYNPQPASEESTLFWNTGIEFSEVDTLFNSIANPNLPNDKTLNRLFFNVDWAGISTQLSTAKETDNVDKDTTKPQIETLLNQLVLNYTLTEEPEKDSLFDTIGTPSLSVQWANTSQSQIRAATIVTEDLDIESDMLSLAANFSKDTWSWGWSYSESDQANKIDPTQDSVTWTRDMNANYQFSEEVVITPTIQSQSSDIAFDGSSTDTNLYNLGLQFIFSDTTSGQFNLNQSITESNSISSPQDTNIATASFQFTWNWIIAKNNKPGFDIALTGTYQDTQDNITPANDLETYQMFLSLVMSLPLSSAE